jgi:mono/diheme cytochrome c family protein
MLMLAIAVVSPARTETLLERGAYLMNGVAGCGNCHSPFGANGPIDPELSGGPAIVTPVFTAHPPNITPDTETGIGTWTDQQIITAIRDGKRPDGTVIRPPMPVGLYRGISDTDVRAIVAYLRSVPAVHHQVPAADYRIPVPPGYGPPVGSVPEVPRTDRVAYGAYLGRMAHCLHCHTPLNSKGARDYDGMPGAGGLDLTGPWGAAVSANITPDPETGIGGWTDRQIKQALTQGVRPDGSVLGLPMPVYYLRNVSDDDLDAIIAWLRTLRPIQHRVK